MMNLATVMGLKFATLYAGLAAEDAEAQIYELYV